MKLQTTVLAVLLSTGAATALASNWDAYAGLAGGADFFTENRVATETLATGAVGSTSYANDSIGFAGDLKVGGSYAFGKFSVGLVADALAQTGKSDLQYRNAYTQDALSKSLPKTVSSKGYESMPFSFGLSLAPAMNVSENSTIYFLAGARIGQFKSHEVVIVKSGIGKVLAAMTCQYLIDKFKPSKLNIIKA